MVMLSEHLVASHHLGENKVVSHHLSENKVISHHFGENKVVSHHLGENIIAFTSRKRTSWPAINQVRTFELRAK